jgi:hypothetical protein
LSQSWRRREHRRTEHRPACNPAKLTSGKFLERHHCTRGAGINLEQNKAALNALRLMQSSITSCVIERNAAVSAVDRAASRG